MLLAEVPAAPALAGDLLLELGLAVILSFCVAYGLVKTYEYSFGAFLNRLAKLFTAKIPLTNIGIPGGGAVASAIDKANHWVLSKLGYYLRQNELLLARWWHDMGLLARYTYDSLAYLAATTHSAVDAIVNGVIPSVVQGATHPLTVGLGKLGAKLEAAERSLERRLTLKARALEAEIELDFGKAWRGIDHLKGALAGGLAHVLGLAHAEVVGLSHYVYRHLARRLRLLEELLAGGAIAAAGLWIVSRTFPWLRCSNVRNVGRALCRFPTGLLEALLADALEAAVLVNICQAVKILSSTAKAFEPELRGLVAVTGAAVQCSGGDAPAPLPARGAALPGPTPAAELPGV